MCMTQAYLPVQEKACGGVALATLTCKRKSLYSNSLCGTDYLLMPERVKRSKPYPTHPEF
jgi:hypothetical protein